MSVHPIVTQIDGRRVSVVEYLGSSFAERKKAVAESAAFKKACEQALADNVAVHIGNEVDMTFRPSYVTLREYRAFVPCYSVSDDVRIPLTRRVTVHSVDHERLNATVTTGDEIDGRFDALWSIALHNIIDIELINEKPEQS